jgi:hypothetical protein
MSNTIQKFYLVHESAHGKETVIKGFNLKSDAEDLFFLKSKKENSNSPIYTDPYRGPSSNDFSYLDKRYWISEVDVSINVEEDVESLTPENFKNSLEFKRLLEEYDVLDKGLSFTKEVVVKFVVKANWEEGKYCFLSLEYESYSPNYNGGDFDDFLASEEAKRFQEETDLRIEKLCHDCDVFAKKIGQEPDEFFMNHILDSNK